MWERNISLAVLLPGLLLAQDLSTPFAPGDSFSISHTPMNAKLVPLDCDAKKIPVHTYKHAGNEATFLIPEDSPTCTYEVNGTTIKVVRGESSNKKLPDQRVQAMKLKPQ